MSVGHLTANAGGQTRQHTGTLRTGRNVLVTGNDPTTCSGSGRTWLPGPLLAESLRYLWYSPLSQTPSHTCFDGGPWHPHRALLA